MPTHKKFRGWPGEQWISWRPPEQAEVGAMIVDTVQELNGS